jgi:hypothetical protein
MTLSATRSYFAVLLIGPSLLTTTAAAQSIAFAPELYATGAAAAQTSTTDDPCASKRDSVLLACGGGLVDYYFPGTLGQRIDTEPAPLRGSDSVVNTWRTITAESATRHSAHPETFKPRARNRPPQVLVEDDSLPTEIKSDDVMRRLSLKERLRESLGGWNPTGLQTLTKGRAYRKIGVEFLIRFH